MEYPSRIYGVDFSGAKDAGRKIWISSGAIEGEGLLIETCFRGDDLPGSGRKREQCLEALKHFIQSQQAAAFGLDFPFGLPEKLVDTPSWEDFILRFPGQHQDPESFRKACREFNQGKELRRTTDLESKTPFSPYNLRLFRQTYFGISKVLEPLVREQWASVLPMQRPLSNEPWILEICPASTLKKLDLYKGYKYKVKTGKHREVRLAIRTEIESKGDLTFREPSIHSTIIEDRGGDALDSVIAALATFHAIRDPERLFPKDQDTYAIEGYVYT